ncbi:hypothetical protein JNJ66_04695 [Candidatus Saccharibacteria bacterium]|nr:hypothetical protein [Candidatus Saccharibacteria bacterium]
MQTVIRPTAAERAAITADRRRKQAIALLAVILLLLAGGAFAIALNSTGGMPSLAELANAFRLSGISGHTSEPAGALQVIVVEGAPADHTAGSIPASLLKQTAAATGA